jgi:hypothetical protein
LWLLDATAVTWLDEDEVSGEGDDEVMLGAAGSDKASAEAALWRITAREQSRVAADKRELVRARPQLGLL